MTYRGGASCHAERLTELEEGTSSVKRYFPYAWLRGESIKSFAFCRKYFDPNEDGGFDSYGSAGGEYDPYDYMTGERLFIILHRFLSMNYRNHQSYNFGILRHVSPSILGYCNLWKLHRPTKFGQTSNPETRIYFSEGFRRAEFESEVRISLVTPVFEIF